MPIVKILTHKRASYRKLLDYIMDESSRLYDDTGRSVLITHNVRGKSIDKWVEQLKSNEERRARKRRKNAIMLYHEIISWSPLDTPNLRIEKLEAMVREYIRFRNPKGLFIAAPHFNKGHVHIHLCISPVDRDGKVMRLAREELRQLKEQFYEFQQKQFPEIKHSPNRTRSKSLRQQKGKVLVPKQFGTSQRETVRSVVQECYAKSRSKEEFYEKLTGQGLQTYMRGGKVYGVMTNGKKYRFNGIIKDIYSTHSQSSRLTQITHFRQIKGNKNSQSLEID